MHTDHYHISVQVKFGSRLFVGIGACIDGGRGYLKKIWEFGLRLPSSNEAVLSHFEPELAARLSIDLRVTAGGFGVTVTGGGILMAVVEPAWSEAKECA